MIAPDPDAQPGEYGRAIARLAAWRAMADELDPTDAADAIYEAARRRDDAGLAEMAQVLAAVLDDGQRALAQEVQPDQEILERLRTASLAQEPGAEAWSPAQLLPAKVPLAGLVLPGGVARVVGGGTGFDAARCWTRCRTG